MTASDLPAPLITKALTNRTNAATRADRPGISRNMAKAISGASMQAALTRKFALVTSCRRLAMLLQEHGNCKERGRHKDALDPEWCPGHAGLAQCKGPEHQRGHKAAQEHICPRGKLVKDSLVGNIAGPTHEGGHQQHGDRARACQKVRHGDRGGRSRHR